MAGCWRIAWVLFLLVVACTPDIEPTSSTDDTRLQLSLAVAWAVAGDLFLWRDAQDALPLVTGDVIRPFFAPDGETIVLTRGADNQPRELWVMAGDETAQAMLTYDDDRLLGDIQWHNNETLYVSYLTPRAPMPQPRHDVHRVTISTGDQQTILAAGEGGRFRVSPDGRWLAFVTPGIYQQEAGQIGLYDLSSQAMQPVLSFDSVASGSEAAFYPALHWLPDSNALLTTIPDADLIYATGADRPTSTIWRVDVSTQTAEPMGTIQAAFFGLPVWSDSGRYMAFMGTDNRLMLADGAGDNAQAIALPDNAYAYQWQWLPNSDTLLLLHSGTGQALRLNAGDETPALQPFTQEAIFAPQFVSPQHYVFLAPVPDSDQWQLRHAQIGQPSQFIARVSSPAVAFDAALAQ